MSLEEHIELLKSTIAQCDVAMSEFEKAHLDMTNLKSILVQQLNKLEEENEEAINP